MVGVMQQREVLPESVTYRLKNTRQVPEVGRCVPPLLSRQVLPPSWLIFVAHAGPRACRDAVHGTQTRDPRLDTDCVEAGLDVLLDRLEELRSPCAACVAIGEESDPTRAAEELID